MDIIEIELLRYIPCDLERSDFMRYANLLRLK